MKKPFVYIAGPYRSAIVNGIAENIAKARVVAVECWRLGFTTICPHLNSMFMDGAADDDVFLIGDLDILDALAKSEQGCVVVLVDGWQESKGACMEVEFARQKGILIFENIEELKISMA